MSKKHITIINRHFPPNRDVTGENAWDLANYLIESYGIEVHIVHIDREKTGGGISREPVGELHKVKTVYAGQNRILRYLAGMWDGFLLIRKAKRISKGPLIVMTSPPLLPMWASMMLGKRDWILWSMDLFPEGFGADNEISSKSAIYQFFFRKTYANAPQRIISLGPGQKRNIEAKYGKMLPGVILPCGVFINNRESSAPPEWKADPDKIYFGYCGNCSKPHNPEFIKAAIDHIDPARQVLILVVYGIYAEEIKAYAKGKSGIQMMDNVPRNELGHIDVHLITLVKPWTHIAVPSKAVSSICSGSGMIFCGDMDSDNWQLLNEAGWFVEDGPEMKQNLKKLMDGITTREIDEKRQKAIKITENLNQMVKDSYDTIASWVN
ncbi:MAG: glycosyltransferase family 4 protein [Bacteroidetes bacterium]|nr:glycosyltransferase family 4 protein [Bacteroidota bacterium]